MPTRFPRRRAASICIVCAHLVDPGQACCSIQCFAAVDTALGRSGTWYQVELRRIERMTTAECQAEIDRILAGPAF